MQRFSVATDRGHTERVRGLLLAAVAAVSLVLAPPGGATAFASAVAPKRPAPPERVAMSWRSAGAFVWHATHVDPAVLGAQMRRAGFGWVALHVADGARETELDRSWVESFRASSGLPVGGWSVLRKSPLHDARRAARLVHVHRLDFYVANAEREYAYTNDSRWSPVRYERSRRFVAELRRLKPRVPAALSSYCRPDMHDLDWGAWRDAGFAFLPQAYVNDFGSDAAPALCAAAASAFFPTGRIHPTVGAWIGARGKVPASTYGRLLGRAGTRGFSIYLADNGMDTLAWRRYGDALRRHGLADRARS